MSDHNAKRRFDAGAGNGRADLALKTLIIEQPTILPVCALPILFAIHVFFASFAYWDTVGRSDPSSAALMTRLMHSLSAVLHETML